MKDDTRKRNGRPQEDEEEEEDDRKPPARVVFVSNDDDEKRRCRADDSVSTTTSLTALLTPATATSRSTAVMPRGKRKRTDSSRHRIVGLYDELLLLTGTALLSLVTLLYTVLPTTALVSLLLLVLSIAAILYTVVQAVVREYRHVVTHRGMASVFSLPEWLQYLLAQQTLDEFMSDPTFGLEYRHLLLYFLPLSTEQLQAAVAQLAPHHRERLQRRGLGHLLGPSFMRLLVGDEGLATMNSPIIATTPQQRQSPPLHLPSTPQRRLVLRVDEDVDSSSSTEKSADHATPRIHTNRTPVSTDTNQLTAPKNTIPTPDSLQEAYDEEGRVLSQAIADTAYTSAWQPAWDWVASYLEQWTRPAAQGVFRYGLGLSLTSTSLGLLWWRARPLSSVIIRRHPWPAIPSRRDDPVGHAIWMTALYSGATALVTLGLQSWYYGTSSRRRRDNSSGRTGDSAASKDDSENESST